MRQPKRSDDKYWTGTRIFHEEQFISDLQDHIDYLNERNQALSIADVVKSLPNDEEVKAYIDTLPYYGTCTTEYNEGFEDGIKWLKGQMSKWGYVLRIVYATLRVSKTETLNN